MYFIIQNLYLISQSYFKNENNTRILRVENNTRILTVDITLLKYDILFNKKKL